MDAITTLIVAATALLPDFDVIVNEDGTYTFVDIAMGGTGEPVSVFYAAAIAYEYLRQDGLHLETSTGRKLGEFARASYS